MQIRIRLLNVALATAMACAMLVPVSASAAETTTWSLVDVRLIVTQSGPVVLVAAELPESAKLPADVSLAVPKGAKIEWAGEVLGGDLSQDPTVEYETVPGDGYDEIRFTLTKGRRGQIEYAAPNAISQQGTQQRSEIVWNSGPASAPEGNLSIEVPQNAKIVDDGGGQAATLNNVSFYLKQFKPVKPNQPLQYAVTYEAAAGQQATPSPGAAPPAGGGTQLPRSGTVSPLLLALVAAALVGGTLFVLRRIQQRQAEDSGEE